MQPVSKHEWVFNFCYDLFREGGEPSIWDQQLSSSFFKPLTSISTKIHVQLSKHFQSTFKH